MLKNNWHLILDLCNVDVPQGPTMKLFWRYTSVLLALA